MASFLNYPTSERIIKDIYFIRLQSYISLSSLVLYLYYYGMPILGYTRRILIRTVTTLDSVISVMWGTRFGLGKILFYFIFHSALRHFCEYQLLSYKRIYGNVSSLELSLNIILSFGTARNNVINAISYISAFIIILFGDFALHLKLYALYRKSRKILTFLIVIAISMVIYYLSLAIMIIKNWTTILTTDPEANLSTRSALYPSYYNRILIPKLITEGVMLVLALRVGVKNMRQNRGIEMSNSLSNILVKDSIFYFVVIFSLCLFHQLLWSLADPEIFGLTPPFSLTLASILSQHLLVTIRIQASRRERMETDFSLEGIQFQSGLGFDEGVPNRSFGSIHPSLLTQDLQPHINRLV
ncbi:hypothetical protein PNOK_0827000 [Pyrrhoderma noxium]|uniref:Uncharacterized protein n=1 Tax=Pyrrhoderma noxium TaxID=2282107 RepID=A0A286UAQ0_9AGAM|nr:hypothetical protein PNOK_0827000 [Pyrrhoderma noxium]